ncbi:MAG TPA: hypothetical protein ENK05_01355 [Gammaproteobacteria bacterium]|nr:hypothetical protein [Gammaproteobacteria bacterium]
MNVVRTIDGHKVVVSAVFKGSPRPAYWQVSINDRILPQTFASTIDAFRYVSNTGLQNVGGYSGFQ